MGSLLIYCAIATENAELKAQVKSLNEGQSSSSSEVLSLKRRIDDVEREKRDLVNVLSMSETEKTSLTGWCFNALSPSGLF